MTGRGSREIIERWLEEFPVVESPEDGSELLALLRDDASAARQLVEAAMLRVALRETCRKTGRPHIEQSQRRSRWMPLALAASLLIAGIAVAAFFLHSRQNKSPQSAAAQLESGYVIAGGTRLTTIPDGTRFDVPAGASVAMRLHDGSEITADSGAAIAIERNVGNAREVITLFGGAAEFDVTPDAREFRIETATGRVGVIGTHFRVAVLPAEMPIKNGMSVEVASGIVHVSCGPINENLPAGVDRSFVQLTDGREGKLIAGVIASLDSARRKITLADGGTYRVSLRATISIDGKTSRLEQLRVGMTSRLVVGPSGSEAIVIFAAPLR